MSALSFWICLFPVCLVYLNQYSSFDLHYLWMKNLSGKSDQEILSYILLCVALVRATLPNTQSQITDLVTISSYCLLAWPNHCKISYCHLLATIDTS